MTQTKYKAAIIAPTCFYYQAAIFQNIAANTEIDLTVYFCSQEGLTSHDVRSMYQSDHNWDTEEELLDGYQYKFMRNYSPSPSYLKWPFGLINFGILWHILRDRPNAVVLMSWMNPTWWMAIAICLLTRVPFLYMTDANFLIEHLRSSNKRNLKILLLGKILFRLCSGFLCAGTANKQFYISYGVPKNKLFSFAYSWGYERLLNSASILVPKRSELRSELGFTEDDFVFLYCGRLSPEKNLKTMLGAYKLLVQPNKALAIVGDGALRKELEEYVAIHNISNVKFFGFQSRETIPNFYAISDALVLVSLRETWGMVVNEAMCFGLPIIASKEVGAGVDLVKHGYNGFRVDSSNTESIHEAFESLMTQSSETTSKMASQSLGIIREWNDRNLGSLMVQYLDTIIKAK